MTASNENKQYWFIPKRANLHQMLVVLDGIITRNFHGKAWNAHKQDTLNLDLKNWGATKEGGKIAPQGMRTLLASTHYLGFVYLDTDTTPTTIKITQAGEEFYNAHKDKLVKMNKLDTKNSLKTSNLALNQLNKLQITNPIILKYCEDIYVFPFRVTLMLLKHFEYLDMEEIALYVFHIKDESEIDYKINEIKLFRELEKDSREQLVENYKKTEAGNITLKQAPSAGYFMQFCVASGIIERKRKSINNSRNKLSAIRIKENKIDEVDEILDFYSQTKPYDFERNLDLWIKYFGDTNKKYTPVHYEVTNHSDIELYIEIEGEDFLDLDILAPYQTSSFPVFPFEDYKLNIYSIAEDYKIYEKNINVSQDFNLTVDNKKLDYSTSDVPFNLLEFDGLTEEVLQHSNSSNFSEKMKVKLRIINSKFEVDKISDKSLRGAQYEYLFYLLLNRMKERNLVDEVIWNGKLGKFNLPVPAPGGKMGTPDIVFIIDNIHYVFELTTIKSKSGQFNAELSSVPDHIKLYTSKTLENQFVKGIFCAPKIHERNHKTMSAILQEEDIDFISIEDTDILNIFSSNTKSELKKNLASIFDK